MGNEKVAHALRDRSDQKTFYDTLKKYKGDSHALQKTLGELKSDKHDGISSDKARIIAKELIRSGRRFVTPENNQRRSMIAPAPASSPSQERQQSAPSQSNAGQQLSNRLTRNNSAITGSGLIAHL